MRTKQPTPEEMAVLEETLAVLAEENPEILNEFLPALATRLGPLVARYGPEILKKFGPEAVKKLGPEAAKKLAAQGGKEAAKKLAAQGGKEAARQFIKNAAKKIIDSAKKELMNMAKEQAITLVKNKILEKAPDSMKGIVSGLLESPLVAAAFQEEIHGKRAPGVKPGDPQVTPPGTASVQEAVEPTITEGSVEEKTIIIEEILKALNEAHCNSAHGRDTAIMPMGGPLASAIAPLPPIGSPVGGCGGGDPHVSKTHKEYDDTHMLKKSLEILANQALALHDAIAGGMTLPSWAEAKVYCATDDIKGVHANLDRGRVASGPQAPIIQLAEGVDEEDIFNKDHGRKRFFDSLKEELGKPEPQRIITNLANSAAYSPFGFTPQKPLKEVIEEVIKVSQLRNFEHFKKLRENPGRLPRYATQEVVKNMNNYFKEVFPKEETKENLKAVIENSIIESARAFFNGDDTDDTTKIEKIKNEEAYAETVGAPSIEREKYKK